MAKECAIGLQVNCTHDKTFRNYENFTFLSAYIHTCLHTLDTDDFVVNQESLELVFSPETPVNSEICFDVNATNDMLVEEDETLMVQTTATNNLDVITWKNSVMDAILTIEDDDGKYSITVLSTQ